MPDVLAAFSQARTSGAGWVCRCPAHDDQRSSLSITHGDRQPWLLKCHAGCTTEAIVDAAGLTMADILTPRNGNGASKPRIAATYDYATEDGALLYQAVRLLPKDFRQRRPDGAGGWIWNLEDTRRVLFGLPELQGQRVVYVAEGEKDVLALRGIGLTATCNAGGAGKWRQEYAQQLIAATVQNVVVIPNNDDPGRTHGEQVAHSCYAAGLKVKVVHLPDLPPKGDVSNWLDAGRTRDELIAIVKATALYMAADEATNATIIDGNAHNRAMTVLQPAEREPAANVGGAGCVDIAVTLSELVAAIQQYVVMGQEQAIAVALWAVHTHAFEAAVTTPYIAINSAAKRSGRRHSSNCSRCSSVDRG